VVVVVVVDVADDNRVSACMQYAVESQIRFHGYDPEHSLIQLRPRDGEHTLRLEDILDVIEREGESVALVMLSGVQFYTGQFFRIADITAAAQAKGCIVGWDLAHAVGNVPLKLHEWNVDWAVWCNYKYMNSGPGAIGGCFVHEKHATSELQQFCGWWGHDLTTRFEMDAPFQPIAGAFRFRLSNPPVLQVASLLASLQLFEQATMERLREKSLKLTAYLELVCKTQDTRHKTQDTRHNNITRIDEHSTH
jgi:kynureninase